GHDQRNFAQEGDAEIGGGLARAAMAEDVVAIAGVGGDKEAHVFDDAEHGDVGAPEHVDGFLRVDQGQILRGGDDHRAGQLDLLDEGNLDIAGTGGHVDDEDVEFAPGGFAQELAQGGGGHGAAPDDGLAAGQHGADGHGLEPKNLERLEDAV